MKTIHKVIIGTFSILLLFIFVINPELTINSMLNGINLWATKILPTLFPFFVLTKIISISGTFDYVSNKLSKITKTLYNTSGISSYVFICSIISGYPIGVKLVSELYKSNKISCTEAKKIVSFTSTSGPLFIIGTVGVGLFQNKTMGYLILISHIMSAILNGLIYRNKYINHNSIENISTCNNKLDLDEIIYSSITSILMVGAYISLFYMIICIIDYYNIFKPILEILSHININSNITKSILYGTIEVTKGCIELANTNLNQLLKLTISTSLISFGGLSIHMQSLIFLKSCNIKYKTFLLQKTTQTILAIIIAYSLGSLFL